MTGQALPKEQNSLDANMETTPTSSSVSGSSTTSGTETASTPTTLLGAELFVDTEDPHSDGTDRAIVAGGVLGALIISATIIWLVLRAMKVNSCGDLRRKKQNQHQRLRKSVTGKDEEDVRKFDAGGISRLT